jgi:hypothetical protein
MLLSKDVENFYLAINMMIGSNCSMTDIQEICDLVFENTFLKAYMYNDEIHREVISTIDKIKKYQILYNMCMNKLPEFLIK